MPRESKEFYEFRKQLKFLAAQKGSGTELISVYIPPGANVSEVSARLRDEYGQAMNIKSKQTRKNVQSAIDRILQMLKGVHKPPANGVAIFCGSTAGKIELYTVVPPEPVAISVYRCDSQFFLDPMLEMAEKKETYGLFVLDRREATVALLKGKRTEIIKYMTSRVPGKHRKGGQCVHEDSLVLLGDGSVKHVKDVVLGEDVLTQEEYKIRTGKCSYIFSRNAKKAYVIETKYPALKIIVTPEHRFFAPENGGIATKYADELFVGDGVLILKKNLNISTAKIKRKIAINPEGKFYDLTVPKYECFIANNFVLHNSSVRFERLIEQAAHEFFKKVGEICNEVFADKNVKGVIAGGSGPTKYDFIKGDYLQTAVREKIVGVIDTSYTDEFGIKELIDRSGEVIANLEATMEKELVNKFLREVVTGGLATYGKKQVEEALVAGQVDTLLLSEGLDDKTVEEFSELAEKSNASIEMISVDVPEGQQLLIAFGGIGALLRYK